MIFAFSFFLILHSQKIVGFLFSTLLTSEQGSDISRFSRGCDKVPGFFFFAFSQIQDKPGHSVSSLRPNEPAFPQHPLESQPEVKGQCPKALPAKSAGPRVKDSWVC